MSRSVFESRRGPLEIPRDKPEPIPVKLERMPPRKQSRLSSGMEIGFVVLLSLFVLSWLAKQLFGR